MLTNCLQHRGRSLRQLRIAASSRIVEIFGQ